MAQDSGLPTSTRKSSLTKERVLRLSASAAPASVLTDKTLFDGVFSGGYYIMYTDEELSALSSRTTRGQQKRNKKNEEALQLANATRQLIDEIRRPAEQHTTEQHAAPLNARHERLLEEIYTLINRSDLISNPHEQHLRDEITLAREQLLRGGAVDDFTLMQTLQEIAELQGLTLGASSVAGRATNEVYDPPEPAVVEAPMESNASARLLPPVIGSTPFDRDREEYLQREFEQFCAYDISEVGGSRSSSSFFFAQKIMDGLVEVDTRGPAEPEGNELAPN